jgi:hypothetical protein
VQLVHVEGFWELGCLGEGHCETVVGDDHEVETGRLGERLLAEVDLHEFTLIVLVGSIVEGSLYLLASLAADQIIDYRSLN